MDLPAVFSGHGVAFSGAEDSRPHPAELFPGLPLQGGELDAFHHEEMHRTTLFLSSFLLPAMLLRAQDGSGPDKEFADAVKRGDKAL